MDVSELAAHVVIGSLSLTESSLLLVVRGSLVDQIIFSTPSIQMNKRINLVKIQYSISLTNAINKNINIHGTKSISTDSP